MGTVAVVVDTGTWRTVMPKKVPKASFDCDAKCVAETEKAVLCVIDGEDLWIPKGQILDESEVWKKGDEGTLVMTEWIAQKKGLF